MESEYVRQSVAEGLIYLLPIHLMVLVSFLPSEPNGVIAAFGSFMGGGNDVFADVKACFAEGRCQRLLLVVFHLPPTCTFELLNYHIAEREHKENFLICFDFLLGSASNLSLIMQP